MKTVWTLARRELRSLFDHPTGYILLVVFVAVTDFLFFRQAYLMNLASLRPMLQLLPWVFLFFIPAVTMRSLAEDVRSGMLEVVLAQPVSEAELLGGKYLGQLLFVWIALALTVPVALGLSLGADLQVGVIVAQFVGAVLLAAGLVAVGLWASSTTPNQITAFIVGVAVMFALILVGVDMALHYPARGLALPVPHQIQARDDARGGEQRARQSLRAPAFREHRPRRHRSAGCRVLRDARRCLPGPGLRCPDAPQAVEGARVDHGHFRCRSYAPQGMPLLHLCNGAGALRLQ